MNQLPLFQSLLWSVTDLTRYIRELFEGDDLLQDVWVQGEVSNLSRPSSGHVYFTLKDASATLRCVMWRSTVQRQLSLPRDGDAVQVHGSLNVYEAGGQYQLYVDLIRPAGEGALYQEFLRLKARLEAEGLFDPSCKRPIPAWPRRIGVVTSPSGAALRDILNTLRRRFPLAEVVIAPTPVQGAEAPAGIVAALKAINRLVLPDVILLARGGGSIEDLWAFNDEQVARAIVASPAPVICGVGHETDFTIADFASDLRAPTPTAAAELATPDRMDLLDSLSATQTRLERTIQASLNNLRWSLDTLDRRLQQRSPLWMIASGRQRLDDLLHRVAVSLDHSLALHKVRIRGLEQSLSALSPSAILERGYAVVSHQDGRTVRQVNQVASDDLLTVRVSDGEFSARVSPDDDQPAR
jgi:exodeoxyribonuclease VII large subunit